MSIRIEDCLLLSQFILPVHFPPEFGRKRETGHVDLPWLRRESGHQLLVADAHHLGARQVDGVVPGPVVVEQVGEAEELSLHYGGMSPVDFRALTGLVDVAPRVLNVTNTSYLN